MMARVLSVGQCGFDHGSITRQMRQRFGAEVVGASDAPEAIAALRGGGFDLVLVNRVLDGDGSSGLDLIRTLKADPALSGLPVMLVSNYASAQDQAMTLGALKGFGKSDLGREPFLAAMRRVFPVDAP
jgi:two-component system chemotaxis response regulator CheY